jgi:hypothetical protein
LTEKKGRGIMVFLNWILGTSNEKAGRLVALEAKKQQELRQSSAPVTEMDEGDFHPLPEGYSANTAYPETQYGSGFDEEADWNEEY